MSARGAGRAIAPAKLLAILALVFVALAGSAMLRTSATFDEPLFLAAGARGLITGDFGLVPEHPRLPQYLYGVPTYFITPHFPAEAGEDWQGERRYDYARHLLWLSGNNPEPILLAARLVDLAFGLLTVLGTYFVTRRHPADPRAFLAALLVAFLPDMLAHSGIAYNDVPVTFFFLVSVYALDRAVREPTPARVALAALATALTVCVKFSALVLGPVAVVLVAVEAASGRWRDAAWRRSIWRMALLFAVVAWATIALVYLGDWRLEQFVAGIVDAGRHSAHGRPAYLLGESRYGGWWYFYPIALAFKTPAALHALALVALGAAVIAWIRRGTARAWMVNEARAPLVGAAFLMAAAMASGFNIGVRHVLPAMPLVCILVAQGVAPVWEAGGRVVRTALAALVAGCIVSTLGAYPYFISYLNEYTRGRLPHEILVDSNIDWGQGLVALKRYMDERGIDRVALGYFGTAIPQGYGLRYVALPSFSWLYSNAPADPPPRYIVVSATQLVGAYMRGDPFAKLREHKPIAIIGGSLYVYDREALGLTLLPAAVN